MPGEGARPYTAAMVDLPPLVVAAPGGSARFLNVRAAPDLASGDLGDVPAGQALQPIGLSRDGRWYAVGWGGRTGWVHAPLTRRADATAHPHGLPFAWPVGPPEARGGPALPAAWYVAVGFGERYRPAPGRTAVHPGLDLNLRSGGDTDLDAPVYACADGLVTASGRYPVWGDIVLVRHALPDGRALWSQYAHLNRRLVEAGAVVGLGAQLGTVGKGEGSRFLAHLHFEIRSRDLPAPHWPGTDEAAVRAGYLDPRTVVGGAAPGLEAYGSGSPLLGLWEAPHGVWPDEAVGPGAWLGRRLAIGHDPEAAPEVDLGPLEARGLRVVLCLVDAAPGPGRGSLPHPERDGAFARTVARTIERTRGTPWAVLVGADADVHGAPDGGPARPERVAEAFNLAYERARAVLAATGRADVRVGPGPLGATGPEAEVVGFWRRLLAAVSDADVLAVRARAARAGPADDPAAGIAPDGLADPLYRYRALLAAVPSRLVERPALVAPLEAGGPVVWLPAAAANVRAWNLAGAGPRVVAILAAAEDDAAEVLDGLRRADDVLSAPLRFDPPGASADWRAVAPAPRGPTGKGMFVRWPGALEGGDGEAVARLARGMGLDFVVLKATHRDRPSHGEPDPVPVVAACLRAAGIAVWGWGTVAGERPEVEGALLVDRARALGAAGWVVEPLSSFPPAAAAPLAAVLRLGLGAFPLAVLCPPGPETPALGALACAAVTLMARVASAGEIGLATAALARHGATVVPVLDLAAAGGRSAPAAGLVRAFLEAAADGHRPGAALLAWDDVLHAGQSTDLFRAVGCPWPPAAATLPATTLQEAT